MRFFAAQLIAYVVDGLWLENARAANGTAQRIAERLAATPGVTLAHPVEVNQIFAHIAPAAHKSLQQAGIDLRRWGSSGGDLYRLVTSYCDPEALVMRLEAALAGARTSTAGR